MKQAARKSKTQKYMSDENFAELEESLNQALEYEKGARKGYRVTRRELPPVPKQRSKAQIAKLRHDMQCSQSAFAKLLNVSIKTVQAWEQGTRKPSDAALKLLAVAEKYSDALYAS
jgi:putative transcriptional regulator